MKTAPDPIYVQEFLFKQSSTSQVFNFKTSIPVACNLLVADKKRGLLYIGHDDRITVLKPAGENNAEWKIELQLPDIISKIAINCDYNYIAVAVALKPIILIYDAQSLARNNLNLLLEITSTNKVDSYVKDIRWNPTIPVMLCTVSSDYSIGNFQLKIEEGIKENSIPKVSAYSKVSNELHTLCAAWSPKGKQVAVGCKNGDIVQLKPDTLKIARTIVGPSPSIGEVISIVWISNYQFCAAYSNNERHINVLIIDAPKGETNAIFTCYEDITYGCVDTEENVPRYYFEHVPEWGLIIAGSSISSEIAVLGTADGGVNWNQWQLVDSGRAQLPLMRTTEIYPVGLAVDKSSTSILPWGTDSTLPYPVPILHILGTSGRLCSFHMINLAPNCPAINSPPTEIVATPTPSHPIVSSTTTTELSFNMNTAITSTPRPKQTEVMLGRSKPAPVANIFGESLKAAGFFQQPVQQPTVEQPKPQDEKPALIAIAKPIAPKEMPILESAKPEVKLAMDKETSPSQAAEQKASIDDNVRMRAFLQEQTIFEKELRNRLQPLVWECGTDEEKKQLGETSAVIEQFVKDLKDTTNSLSSDIAYLKALLLQSIAWIEETKSKNATSTDISSRNCSENSKIMDLQRWYYYTQTQFNQVNKILDLEWSENKVQAKTKMKIPSLEFVYQNLVIHNKIFVKQKEKFERLSRQWKSLNRSSYTTVANASNLSRSMANLNLSSPKFSSTIRGKNDIIDARCKIIASKTVSFTHEKQLKLKALLTESQPRIVKLVNPSPIQDRLKTTLSSLASVNATAVETKAKAESLVKQSITTTKQTLEKQTKSQNPLASLNSIVARIGSSDTNDDDVIQNKTQQIPLSTTASFSDVISTKQIQDKKPTVAAVAAAAAVVVPSQTIKPKQDVGISFPSSITFGTSTQKSQDVLFLKSSVMDTTAKSTKQPTMNDNIPKTPESALFSTGILKDALSTEHPPNAEVTRIGIARNLPSLSITPVVKMDSAATFSFATPNMTLNLVKNTPSNIALDAAMSFTSKPMAHAPAVELSATTDQISMQAPIELSALSSVLGSPNSMALPSNNADGKINTITSSMSFAAPAPIITTQSSAVTTVAVPITNISDINFASTNSIRKATQVSAADTFVIEKTTAPEIKAPNFGSISTHASTPLSTVSIFGGQTIAKSTIPEATTTLPATTIFGAIAFPSITPTFGASTLAPTASVFSGFTNTSAGVTTSVSPAALVSNVSSMSPPFQSSLNKPMFGETTVTSMPAASLGINSSNTPAGTISFGGLTTTMTTTTTTTTTMMTTTTTATAATTTSTMTTMSTMSTMTTTTTTATTATAMTMTMTTTTMATTMTPTTMATTIMPMKTMLSPTMTPIITTTMTTTATITTTATMTTMVAGSPLFGKSPIASPTSNAQFPNVQTPTSSANVFGKPIISPATTPFGNTSGSVFSSSASTTTSSATSIFGNSSMNSVFGTAPLSSTSGNIFGGNSAGFGTPASGSIFDTNAPKSGIMFGGGTNTASPFGNTTNNTSAAGGGSATGTNVFRSTVTNTSPIQQSVLSNQPAFGQSPTFGAKPVFGSSSIFGGSKSVFGGSSFGSPPTFESASIGFGSQPSMQGDPTMENMSKVFGDVVGSSTFESLANQSGGLSFGSLAQKNPESEKPAFNAGSSFSSWR